MPRRPRRRGLTLLAACSIGLGIVGCSTGDGGNSGDDPDLPHLIVSTSIWGDIIERSFGDVVSVSVLMPDGSDPHQFQPSARQAADIDSADLVVVNGAGLEAGLEPLTDAAEDAGVPVFHITDHVTTRIIANDDADGDTHSDDEAADEADDEHGHDEHGHDGGVDPHVWLDPQLVNDAVAALATYLDDEVVDGAVEASSSYRDELSELDTTIADKVGQIPSEQRILVTSHDALGYYADRYGFEVPATVVGSVTTDAEPSTAEIAQVAEIVESAGVRAIFVEANGSTRLADAVVDTVDNDVAVIPVHASSLGEADGYTAMMLNDTEAIVGGLLGSDTDGE